MAKTQKVMHTIAEGNRPTGCYLSTGTQVHHFRVLANTAGQKPTPHRVAAFVLLRSGNDSICQDEIEQWNSEPSRTVT